MDDILAKKNRHLFLEEKDNQNNSFIGNINDVASRKTELDTVAAHIESVDTVGDHIDNVDTVANNISNINDAVNNIATVKTFNDNVNNGTMQYLLEAFTTSLNEQGNAWEVRLTQLGESILATTSAFNYSTVVTVSSDIPANGTLILPNSMKYKVGTHMLMVSWNGTVCYAGDQYDEVGAYGVWATSIKLNQPAKAGDKIQLRIVALTDQFSYVDITEAAINASQFVASGSNTERYLPEFLGDVVNVKNFGAVGNGVNDDTTAFQSAIASGKAVFVPEGTYKLNTDLNGVFCGVGNSIFTGGTVNSSTILRGIAYKNSDIINVKDFGAKGDGIADDASAIQAADDYASQLEGIVLFPQGKYKVVTGINAHSSWLMEGDLVYGGEDDENAYVVNILSDEKYYKLKIDGDGKAIRRLLSVEGDSNNFSSVELKNLKSVDFGSLSGANCGCMVTGNNNSFDFISIRNFENVVENDSLSQGITFVNSSGNIVSNLQCNTCAAAVVTGGNSRNYIDRATIINCSDNGLYALSGFIEIGDFYCSTIDEGIVSIGGSVSIGKATVKSTGNSAVRIANCPYMFIGSLSAPEGVAGRVLATRTTNTSSGEIIINNIAGTFGGLFSLNNGTIEFLHASNIDAVINVSRTGNYETLDSCKGFYINNMNIKAIDVGDIFNSSSKIYFVAPTDNLSKESCIRNVTCKMFNADGITENEAEIRFINLAQELISADGFCWRGDIGPYGIFQKGWSRVPNSINTVPVAGYWRMGTMLTCSGYATNTIYAFVCTASGTPGTWQSLNY